MIVTTTRCFGLDTLNFRFSTRAKLRCRSAKFAWGSPLGNPFVYFFRAILRKYSRFDDVYMRGPS